jgi:lysozyme
MLASLELQDFIRKEEGFRSHAYQDSGGKWTIGYGHTGRYAYPGSIITLEIADKLLWDDLLASEHAVDNLVKVFLTQGQYDALVDFVYNGGIHQFATAPLLKLLNERQYNLVPEHLILYIKDDKGHELEGLKERREKEITFWNQPQEKVA